MNKPSVHYCMGCGKIKIGGVWLDPNQDLQAYLLSHGYCEPCAEKAVEEAKRQIAESKPRIYKISDIGVILCRNCGNKESPNKMKDGLCVFCQKCAGCDNKECEKTLDQDSGSYFCDECFDAVKTPEQRRQETREVLC